MTAYVLEHPKGIYTAAIAQSGNISKIGGHNSDPPLGYGAIDPPEKGGPNESIALDQTGWLRDHPKGPFGTPA